MFALWMPLRVSTWLPSLTCRRIRGESRSGDDIYALLLSERRLDGIVGFVLPLGCCPPPRCSMYILRPAGGLLPCTAAFDGSRITHSWANARCNGVFKTSPAGRLQHNSVVDVHIFQLRLACLTDRLGTEPANTATTDDNERRESVMGRLGVGRTGWFSPCFLFKDFAP